MITRLKMMKWRWSVKMRTVDGDGIGINCEETMHLDHVIVVTFHVRYVSAVVIISSSFTDEWKNFLSRIGRDENAHESELNDNPSDILELRFRASYRGQTLAKTDSKMLQAALDWACGPGKVDCAPLLQGQSCYEPDNVAAHPSRKPGSSYVIQYALASVLKRASNYTAQ
ncbi:hypothetical protein POM88_040349 [Heracleum sosnowskyi]|uniref:X8 domain-containing protein n=1 Tax=Heracleum sosnowskyi TaxID=360622 RepID=A0AAD8MA91_9APIA|nr:hypothetical protein POM88_040349 [Heracleum sosnowskyi]